MFPSSVRLPFASVTVVALGAIGYVQRDRCGVDPEDTLGALLEQR